MLLAKTGKSDTESSKKEIEFFTEYYSINHCNGSRIKRSTSKSKIPVQQMRHKTKPFDFQNVKR